MQHLTATQQNELVASAISSEMADLNFTNLEGDTALDSLFGFLPIEERRNDGRVRDKWLSRYEHIRQYGGMGIYGCDPLTGERSELLQIKPLYPRSPQLKYETPPQSESAAMYPRVDRLSTEKAAQRFGLPSPIDAEGDGGVGYDSSYRNYWRWVIENRLPVIITEGFKKACALISAGFPAVALAGIWNGTRAIRDENGKTTGYRLVDSLLFLTELPKIYIAFDRDEKAATIRDVILARSVLASQFIDHGRECYSLRWDATYKGADDLIAGCGVSAIEESIESAEKLTGEKPNFRKKPAANILGETIAKEWRNKVWYDTSQKLWMVYGGGRWQSQSDELLEAVFYRRIIQDIPEISSFGYVNNVMKFTRCMIAVKSWEEASSLDFIPFKNGVWSFRDRKLLPHDPDYRFTWQLDRDYSAIDNQWHSIEQFLQTVTNGNGDLRNLLIAACAAVLKGRADIQKAIYLFGSGANGKGTFLRLLEMLVGQDNSYSTTLESICENRFEVANLVEKRLVVCPDEDRRVGRLSVFKSITGGDLLRAEKKGQTSFNFRFQGLVAIASNEPIFVGDSSYGLSRRVIPIPFQHTIPPEQRRDMSGAFDKELGSFTTYLLSLDDEWVGQTLKAADRIPAIQTLQWEMTTRVDSVAAFVDAKIVFDPNSTILSSDLYPAYEQYCEKKGFSKKHENNFCPSLVSLCKDKLGQAVDSKRTKKGKRIEGVRLVLEEDGGYGYEFAKEMARVTAVTAKNDFNSQTDPKPPKTSRGVGFGSPIDGK